MKWHQLTEDTELDENNVWDFIQKNCKQYLKENPDWMTRPLYRGMSYRGDIQVKNIRSDRQPTDSNRFFHKLYDEAFIENGYALNRTNSIFCTGDREMAYKYGEAYVIFPMGNFAFVYSPTVKDLYLFSKTFYRRGFLKFDNENEKILTTDDLTEFLRNKSSADKLRDGPFSLRELMAWLDENVYTFGTFMAHTPNDLEELFDRLGFDRQYFYQKFGELYSNDSLDKAIRSNNEIMVSGSKYLAIQVDTFNHMKNNGAF